MDYAQLMHHLQDNGFTKLTTSVNMLTRYVTDFKKENRSVKITWELGGHVRSISEPNKFYSSLEEFLETI